MDRPAAGISFPTVPAPRMTCLEADPELLCGTLEGVGATVLRMLYLRDLRELQDGVNGILETAQQYTANPKTDAALGKVGRG